ncbi:TMEM175 family protein [Metabacillus sp. RGM 3146]|uniref:TMEM175 family protein n=1 Tax=Metabacillus sp. RGM 3146 TaxID=3401092 RepID=UPI003B9B0B11
MKVHRMEAFSDGVLAIIITIMVLEFKVPEGHDWKSLLQIAPKFLSYAFSFVYIGIYWNNHHHLLHTVKTLNGKIMWLNALLLFWLSLIPFSTAWMGETRFAPTPTALYGIMLLFSAISYGCCSDPLSNSITLIRLLSRQWEETLKELLV